MVTPGGIDCEKASEAIKKLLAGKLFKVAVISVAYQKTIIIIIIASRRLRVVIANKEGCFVLMPVGIYGEIVNEAIKKLLGGNPCASSNMCLTYQETIIIIIASRGLRVVDADKEGCLVLKPDGIYGETASEAIKNC